MPRLLLHTEYSGVPLVRELTLASNTDSTISDNPGPGRIIDNGISWGGKYVERSATWILQRAGRRPEVSEPQPAAGTSLARQYTFASNTNSTASGLPGLGLTVGRGLSWGGKYIERLATWTVKRSQRGPEALMMRILETLDKETSMPLQCANCGYLWPQQPPTLAHSQLRSLPLVLEQFLEVNSRTVYCPRGCRPARAAILDIAGRRKLYGKLVSLVNSRNASSRVISLAFIALVAAVFPEERTEMVAFGTEQRLDRLLTLIYEDMGGIDFLLAPSRRALVLLRDKQVVALGLEFLALDGAVIRILPVRARSTIPDDVRNSIQDIQTRRERALNSIVSLLRDTDRQLLAMTMMQKHRMLACDYPFIDYEDNWTRDLFPRTLAHLWTQAAASDDPVCSAITTELLYSIYIRWEDPAMTIFDPIAQFVTASPNIVSRIPARLRVLLREIDARCEAEAEEMAWFWGRRVNHWRRALWRCDADDPRGEPDDDWSSFYYVESDARWHSIHVWEDEEWYSCEEWESGSEEGWDHDLDDRLKWSVDLS